MRTRDHMDECISYILRICILASCDEVRHLAFSCSIYFKMNEKYTTLCKEEAETDDKDKKMMVRAGEKVER